MSNSKKLTAKQMRFVDEYLIDGNATRAAKSAGYSERTAEQTASRLLKIPKVADAIKAGQQEISERCKVTQDDVIEGLLSEAKQMGEGSSHSARVTAWTQLGKHLGMFKEQVDVNASGNISINIEFDGDDNDGTGN